MCYTCEARITQARALQLGTRERLTRGLAWLRDTEASRPRAGAGRARGGRHRLALQLCTRRA